MSQSSRAQPGEIDRILRPAARSRRDRPSTAGTLKRPTASTPPPRSKRTMSRKRARKASGVRLMRITPMAPASSRSARGRPRATTCAGGDRGRDPPARSPRPAGGGPAWPAAAAAPGRRGTARRRSRSPARRQRAWPGARAASTERGRRPGFASPVQYGPFRPSAIVVPRAARRAGRSRPSCGCRSLRSSSVSGGGRRRRRSNRPCRPPAPVSPPDVYVHLIAPRDTLIAVSRALLADPRRWPILQRLNRVRNPRRLRPDRVLAGFLVAS